MFFFQQFVKTLKFQYGCCFLNLESSKIFKNYCLPLETYAKPRNYNFYESNSKKTWYKWKKYRKKNQKLIIRKKIKILLKSAVRYWKSKTRSAKTIFHCSRLKREFCRGLFLLNDFAWVSTCWSCNWKLISQTTRWVGTNVSTIIYVLLSWPLLNKYRRLNANNLLIHLLRLRETHNGLQLPVFFFFFFCQRYPEYQSKELFYRPSNS